MKYKQLLKKYMLHVMGEESVSFVETINDIYSIPNFTDEEVIEMEKIHEEVRKQYQTL